MIDSDTIRTEKFGSIDILRRAWSVFRCHFQPIFTITMIIAIPLNIFVELVPPEVWNGATGLPEGDPAGDTVGTG